MSLDFRTHRSTSLRTCCISPIIIERTRFSLWAKKAFFFNGLFHHLFYFYKQLDYFKPLFIVAFKILTYDISHIDPEILIENQRCLHNIAEATGSCSSGLANQDLGPVSHSWWLTVVNRFLRFYYIFHYKPHLKISSKLSPILWQYMYTYSSKLRSSIIYWLSMFLNASRNPEGYM